ncbi:MAG: twin-arginine translocase TatA/TatE family subunit [Thermoguttaceae bacterium]|nr:twin-arginine translocase TatA/TatE family subunit [Thermoguttaceae bacterium]MBR0190798.1 twin-arginine translocase TatA/TatE family subunit [Thermoguttaceae bacterium]
MNFPLAIFGIGTNELLILGVIAVLLFGTRLPKVARSFGQSVTEFKKGMKEIQEDVEDEDVDSKNSNKKDEE